MAPCPRDSWCSWISRIRQSLTLSGRMLRRRRTTIPGSLDPLAATISPKCEDDSGLLARFLQDIRVPQPVKALRINALPWPGRCPCRPGTSCRHRLRGVNSFLRQPVNVLQSLLDVLGFQAWIGFENLIINCAFIPIPPQREPVEAPLRAVAPDGSRGPPSFPSRPRFARAPIP